MSCGLRNGILGVCPPFYGRLPCVWFGLHYVRLWKRFMPQPCYSSRHSCQWPGLGYVRSEEFRTVYYCTSAPPHETIVDNSLMGLGYITVGYVRLSEECNAVCVSTRIRTPIFRLTFQVVACIGLP